MVRPQRFVLVAALGAGCAAPAAPPPERPLVTVPTVAASVAQAPPTPPPAPAKHERATAPRGYVEVTVVGLVSTPGGAAVLVGKEGGSIVVPIFVGGTEALSIELRRDHRTYERPLTHDLLDSLMRELGGELVKVQVDELRGNTFIGSVYVRKDDRIIQVDARPSDAIALALGAKAPIFVAQEVVDRAGVNNNDDATDASMGPPPPMTTSLPTTKRPLRR